MMKLSMLSRSVALALMTTGYGSAWALGLGEARALSGLNQPLKAEVEVLADVSELPSVKLALASPEAYRQQGLDFPAALAGAQVSLVKRNGARPVAMITAAAPVHEPYVTVMLDGQSANGKVRRVYSVFIDPANTSTNTAPLSKLPGESTFMEVQQKLPILPPLTKVEKAASTPVTSSPASPGAADVQEAQQPLYTNIIEVGDAPSKLDAVQGFGRNVEIKHALFTVVPKGWKGFSGERAMNISGKVSWVAGRSWTQTLDGVLAGAHLSAVVNWQKREITFYSLDGAAKAAAKLSAASADSGRDAGAAGGPAVSDEGSIAAAKSTPKSSEGTSVAFAQMELSKARLEIAAVEKLLREAQAAAKASEEQRVQAQQQLAVESQRLIELRAEVAAHEKAKAEGAALAQSAQEGAAKLEQMIARAEQAEAKSAALAAGIEDSRRDFSAKLEDLRAQLESSQAQVVDERSKVEHYMAQNKHLLTSLDATRDRMAKMRWGAPDPTPEKNAKYSSLRLVNGDAILDSVVGSAGLNVTLPSALSQIVPSGWMVITKPDVNISLVSWTGGQRPWIQVLDDVIKGQNLMATVDAVTREIHVSTALTN